MVDSILLRHAMRAARATAAVLAASFSLGAQALELRVLSAGAVEPGMRQTVQAFERASGNTVRLSFAAAPELRAALAASAPAADVIVAPIGLLRAPVGVAPATTVSIGRVGIGVAVRNGVESPSLDSAEALKASLLGADSIVFNRASTGVYVEAMLARLGIAEAVDRKVHRYPDGASVMRHLLASQAQREFGFGATTEIALFRAQGLRFVGPLPASLQNYTTYAASAWPGAAPADAQRAAAKAALLLHLQTAATRELFAGAGIEPAE